MQLLSLRRLQEEIIVAFQSLRVILNTTQSPQIPIAQLCSPALAMHSLSLHYNLYYDLPHSLGESRVDLTYETPSRRLP